MSSPTHGRRLFPWLPHDYMRRRRAVRRITNISLIAVLSMGTAYFISRPTGGTGFLPPKLAVQPGSSSLPALDPTVTVAPLTPAAAGEAPSGYESSAGPRTVSALDSLVLHDVKRSKDLHVRIFYPDGSGKFPVIVFSHGAGGSQDCCDALTRHWASYGYVTIQPTHDDSAVQRRNTGRDALRNPALWESRPQDISFILDALPSLADRVPGLVGKIDSARIGVGGHSMGSYATEAIAGALVDLPGHPGRNFADPRVKAVLCLSPQGPGQFGLNDHSFDQISLPYIGITGSLDTFGGVARPDWRKTPFERSQPGDKYHVFIKGANPMSFITAHTLVPHRLAEGEAILGYTNSAALAFWDAYLKGDAHAKAYLQSDALEKSSQGAVKLSRR